MRLKPLPDHPVDLNDLMDKVNRLLQVIEPIARGWELLAHELPAQMADWDAYFDSHPLARTTFENLANRTNDGRMASSWEKYINKYLDWPFEWDWAGDDRADGPDAFPNFETRFREWEGSLSREPRDAMQPSLSLLMTLREAILAKLRELTPGPGGAGPEYWIAASEAVRRAKVAGVPLSLPSLSKNRGSWPIKSRAAQGPGPTKREVEVGSLARYIEAKRRNG
ncbi:MAG TPA: hypothetical protein VG406_09315 [Isosphaeraceae bacterium]|jgi:hypothetical protein|nr:hypothetical protein [Isosphaeraceae bacterium]